MQGVTSKIKNCRRCRLWKDAKNAVPGEGSLNTPLLFIGEGPGYWEDIKGRPFVGRAGEQLDELLSDIDLNREDVYITNVVKHRPPNNRDPKQDEIDSCTPYLEEQIKIIKPKLIITLGRHSTKLLLSKIDIKVTGITKIRGKILEGELYGLRIKIMPTFHPAAVLYNPSYKSALKDDFKRIRMELKKQSLRGNSSHQ